jgi:hypothetical protein
MFQWLRKAYDMTKRVLGKVKSGVEGGARLFNKGKEMYTNAKNFATNLPVVGTVAGNAINKFENKANEAVKSRIGVDFKDLNKAVSTAETVAKYLPRG